MILWDSTANENGVQGWPYRYRKPRFALLLTEARLVAFADR